MTALSMIYIIVIYIYIFFFFFHHKMTKASKMREAFFVVIKKRVTYNLRDKF